MPKLAAASVLTSLILSLTNGTVRTTPHLWTRIRCMRFKSAFNLPRQEAVNSALPYCGRLSLLRRYLSAHANGYPRLPLLLSHSRFHPLFKSLAHVSVPPFRLHLDPAVLQ